MLNFLFSLAFCSGGKDLSCVYKNNKPVEKGEVTYCLKRGECNGRTALK
jgi:hypothetical protein